MKTYMRIYTEYKCKKFVKEHVKKEKKELEKKNKRKETVLCYKTCAYINGDFSNDSGS
jgi:uncharacterized protein YutD